MNLIHTCNFIALFIVVALIVYEMLQYYPQWLAEELMETRRKLTIATMELENKKKEMESNSSVY